MFKCSHGRTYPKGLKGGIIPCARCRSEFYGSPEIIVPYDEKIRRAK